MIDRIQQKYHIGNIISHNLTHQSNNFIFNFSTNQYTYYSKLTENVLF